MRGSAPDANLPGAVYRAFIEALNGRDLDAASRLVNIQRVAPTRGLFLWQSSVKFERSFQ